MNETYCGVITLVDFLLLLHRSLIQLAVKENQEVTKPSVLLYKIKAYMSVVQTLENYVHIGN